MSEERRENLKHAKWYGLVESRKNGSLGRIYKPEEVVGIIIDRLEWLNEVYETLEEFVMEMEEGREGEGEKEEKG